MNKFIEVFKGQVSLNPAGVSAVRGVFTEEMSLVVRDELRPMRDLIMALIVKVEELSAHKQSAKSVDIVLENPEGVVGYDITPRYGKKINFAELSPEDKRREELRVKIAQAIYEYAAAAGKSSNRDTFGNLYTSFFLKLRERSGYYPKTKTVYKYLNEYLGRKVYTLIDDGYGEMLYDIIRIETAMTKRGTRKRESTAGKRKSRKANA